MNMQCFWVGFLLFCGFFVVGFCDQDGFLSISCGGNTSYIDSSKISWVPDGEYVSTGNITTVKNSEGSSASNVPIRYFPNTQGRKCYKLPVNNVSSLVLVRARFLYQNYDGLGKPPAFSVSLGRAITSTINLTTNDPWTEEFLWSENNETLSFCLLAIPDGGSPLISSIEVRPLPQGAYASGMGDFPIKSLRKSYRINCGYANGSLRYPLDPYDRIWDADKNFTPFHVSTGFKIQRNFNLSTLRESPPAAVLETARVLARKEVLTYNLPLDTLADYYIVLYFAGIVPVSPSFNLLINGDVVQSNYTVKMSEVFDFGLSKQITQADATHVTTVVNGTAGYLDPEYYSTQQLSEKSDVYSFGVVLLELICGREPLSHSETPDSFNLVLWAKPYLEAGTFEIVPHSGRELNWNICSREHEKGSLRCCEVSRERCITKANYCTGIGRVERNL